MKKLTVLSIPFLFLLCVEAQQPRSRMSPPPSPMNTDVDMAPLPPNVQRRIDQKELQREADDLARTAQTIPADLASVRKGTLPKDFIQKLKQIEKLSKHLRSQISQ